MTNVEGRGRSERGLNRRSVPNSRVRASAVLTSVVRTHHARLVASLAGRLGDLDLAEESVQEAVGRATSQWQEDLPDNPGGWLFTVAYRVALDGLRRRATSTRRLEELAAEFERVPAAREGDAVLHPVLRDDLLRLIFTCCHPSLAMEARVALALKTICGLTTAEVARALLIAEPTMAQRIVRAKRKIAGAGIGFRVPEEEELPERIDGVLSVVYLVFNEAYLALDGPDPIRLNLAEESIRLARLIVQALPDSAQAQGLLALLLLTHARRGARFDPSGRFVRLADQDRSLWNRGEIDEGRRLTDALFQSGGGRTRYGLQAAIATLHAESLHADATPWNEIARLYQALGEIDPSPVVGLNHAVAVAEAEGAEKGLERIEALSESRVLENYAHYHAARGEMLDRLGRSGDAREAFVTAIECVRTETDRIFLSERLAELS